MAVRAGSVIMAASAAMSGSADISLRNEASTFYDLWCEIT
jgi:hypothetical protein